MSTKPEGKDISDVHEYEGRPDNTFTVRSHTINKKFWEGLIAYFPFTVI
jgi:hypothetical protein